MTRKLWPIGIGLVAFLFARAAFAKRSVSSGDPDDASNAGKPGKGPGGAPRPSRGGVTGATRREGVTYMVPDGWDPVRGLWISPDCESVVEGPAWWTGNVIVDGVPEMPALKYGPEGFPENYTQAGALQIPYAGTVSAPLREFLAAQPDVGAVMWVVDRVSTTGQDLQPEDVAQAILSEYAPLCADADPSTWSEAIRDWYQSIVRRISDVRESTVIEE